MWSPPALLFQKLGRRMRLMALEMLVIECEIYGFLCSVFKEDEKRFQLCCPRGVFCWR